MKRAILLALGALSVAAAAIPAMALAADFPPPPPTTFYGKVPAGVATGQGVVAMVTDPGTGIQNACGAGNVLTDGGNTVYVVDVVADAQRPGCGKAGRTVMFYFTPTLNSSGRMSTDSPAAWTGPGPTLKDISGVGPPLTRRASAPQVARDGSY
jgi:hypothetical protein